MPPIHLYSGPLSMFGAKTQIAALEKQLDVALTMVPFKMQTLYEPKHAEVLRINPKRQVPVLVHGDVELFDSTQIFEYFEDLQPEPPLWPADIAARARARLLELKSDEVYFPHIIRLMGLQDKAGDPAAVAARAGAAAFYAELETLFGDGRPWLAGADFSYADIAFYMAQIFGDRMGAPIPAAHARLMTWRGRTGERRSVRQVAGAMARYLLSQNRRVPDFMQALLN
ncbi:MAG: glutathione S-transferase family protein [Ferrovibrio sp.]|uniref:glutathione S-transferase family protein n=1 Tax=Ferrovibrio sp. TaxID=1917215 RepID=UPI0026194C47|nr:glutathione S-transferase family protein [Ferrovibrio sp.]MCW0231985.1 glutathione S-transferase family protein [Ferrovibrio sp.]